MGAPAKLLLHICPRLHENGVTDNLKQRILKTATRVESFWKRCGHRCCVNKKPEFSVDTLTSHSA